MLVSSFNFLQSFNYTPYLFYKKRFKSEINSFCIWTRKRIGLLCVLRSHDGFDDTTLDLPSFLTL
jgi:hypothetical protein